MMASVLAEAGTNQMAGRPEGIQMENNLEQLSRLAVTLNQETDSYTKSLAELEKKLLKMNLGIQAWVPLIEVAKSGMPSRDTCIRPMLGYAKTDEGWGFAIQELRIERGFYEGDESCPYENHYEDEPPKPLLKSSRELRIRAAREIEPLLEALKLRAEEVLPMLRQASELAGQV
jgi:hypothetical protein